MLVAIAGCCAAFGAGVFLMIRLLAALHGIADFWYRMDREWPRVMRGIAAWGLAIWLLSWMLQARYLTAFAAGLIAYLIFYLSLFPLIRIFLHVIRRKPERP